MVSSHPAHEFLPTKPVRSRLAVFGGTFNPVHTGHLFLAGEVIRRGLVDEVLFVPAGIPPHKTLVDLAPAPDRFELLKLALAPYPEFSLSDIELTRTDSPSYTLDTMETMRAAFPENDLFFLLGMDCLYELHTWYRATELVSQFQFIVYPRPGVVAPKYLALADYFGNRNARNLVAAMLDEVPLLPVESSSIRQLCATGGNLAGLVPDTVLAYLQKQGLYGYKKCGKKGKRQPAVGSTPGK